MKVLHSCHLRALLTRAFTLACVFTCSLIVQINDNGIVEFSRTSWKRLRRKYPPSHTALSQFRVNKRWNFTIFPKWYQVWWMGFFCFISLFEEFCLFVFQIFKPLFNACLLLFSYSICWDNVSHFVLWFLGDLAMWIILIG